MSNSCQYTLRCPTSAWKWPSGAYVSKKEPQKIFGFKADFGVAQMWLFKALPGAFMNSWTKRIQSLILSSSKQNCSTSTPGGFNLKKYFNQNGHCLLNPHRNRWALPFVAFGKRPKLDLGTYFRLFGPESCSLRLLEPMPAGDQHVDDEVVRLHNACTLTYRSGG